MIWGRDRCYRDLAVKPDLSLCKRKERTQTEGTEHSARHGRCASLSRTLRGGREPLDARSSKPPPARPRATHAEAFCCMNRRSEAAHETCCAAACARDTQVPRRRRSNAPPPQGAAAVPSITEGARHAHYGPHSPGSQEAAQPRRPACKACGPLQAARPVPYIYRPLWHVHNTGAHPGCVVEPSCTRACARAPGPPFEQAPAGRYVSASAPPTPPLGAPRRPCGPRLAPVHMRRPAADRNSARSRRRVALVPPMTQRRAAR